MSRHPVPHECRAFLGDFSAFIEGELPPERRDVYQAHVDCCQSCLAHLAAYRRGITVLRSIEEAAPVDFWTRLERRLWVGPALSVIEGGAKSRPVRRAMRWPGAAVSLAAAAVLALFFIARGLGPDSKPGDVGPRTVQASVAMTLPQVPEAAWAEAQAAAPVRGRATLASRAHRTVEAGPADADPVAAVLARAETRPAFERELDRLQRSVLRQSLGRTAESRLAADGWVQPVRLGYDGSRPPIVPAALVRPAAYVTPAPWNVDRAVSLP